MIKGTEGLDHRSGRRVDKRFHQIPCRLHRPAYADCEAGGVKPFALEDRAMNMNPELEQRITFNPRQCGGHPCIRGLRIRVSDILEILA